MTWVRISDDFMDHPKVLELGHDAPVALTLWLGGLGYSNRYLTDGAIPAAILPRLTSLPPGELRRAADALVSVGLWERTDTGYQIHDYLDYQKSREWVLEHRVLAKARGVAGANARYGKGVSIDESIDESIDDRQTGGHAPIPTPNPTPNTTTPTPPGMELVVEEYRRLFGHVTDKKRLYLQSIASQWPIERVLEGIRGEHGRGATSKNICGRLEDGLKAGDKSQAAKDAELYDALEERLAREASA